jgi:hypothetical protein
MKLSLSEAGLCQYWQCPVPVPASHMFECHGSPSHLLNGQI